VSTAVEDESMDIREMPMFNLVGDRQWKDTVVKMCLCGCDQFWMLTRFEDDGNIGGYFLDMFCAQCGAWYKAPIPPKDDDLVTS
jgi:hypothetical protein